MAKVFLGVGHGGSDPGAQGGGLDEADINLGIAVACQAELVRHGVQVRMSRTKDEDDPLTEEIQECNAYDPDLAVDIHTNAGGGMGFEAYHTLGGGKGKTLAQNIESEVKAIGQTSRGCKTKANSAGRDYFGFIRETKCPTVICECRLSIPPPIAQRWTPRTSRLCSERHMHAASSKRWASRCSRSRQSILK